MRRLRRSLFPYLENIVVNVINRKLGLIWGTPFKQFAKEDAEGVVVARRTERKGEVSIAGRAEHRTGWRVTTDLAF